ncbi:MAG: S8 family serine peptidase, partial [Anaerolineae bacterium]
MPSHRARSRRILSVLVLVTMLLLAWTIQAVRVYSSEPPERTAPSAAGIGPASVAQPADAWPGLPTKIEPALLKQVVEGDPGDSYRFVVELSPQARLRPLSRSLDRSDRRRQVVARLQTTARETQMDLLIFLESQQAKGRVKEFRSFWIFNGLAVTANADTLLALAARPEVRIIRQDRWRRWVDPLPLLKDQPRLDGNGVEWNISQIQADRVWSALGLDGSGVTVAILDTGVDWQHPAFQTQYRGYKPGGVAIHYGNWICTTDEGYLYPVDGHGHGTHVTGIAVGGRDDAGRAIGVAPGARWIAVKMLDDYGYGYDSWIHASFEWVLAPAGDPALAPDIVNGSWGAQNGADETFRADLQALRAAGIVPIFAAGNEGPKISSLRMPASYSEAIAVGATDDLDLVTTFSARGPSPWGETKPEVVAPGAQIRSTLPGGTYGLLNGTSMAAPHVAGLAAILLQADPAFTVDKIEELVTWTARPLGDEVPNNDTGWGRIDAYQAAAVAVEAGFVVGQVTRHPDQEPLPSTQVTVYDHLGEQRAKAQADDTGRYHLALLPGQYRLGAEAFGYEPRSVPGVTVQAGVTTTVDLTLSPSPAGVLWGRVRNADTGGPVGADLRIPGTPAQTTSDSQTGQYSLALPAGAYTLQAARNGYRRHTIPDIKILADQALRIDVPLTPAPTLLLVDGGRWYYDSQASYFEQALDDHEFVYDLWEIRDLSTDLPGPDVLRSYEITVWSSPLDAPGLIGAGDTISDYLGLGGNLLLTGQDVGYWDGGLSGFGWHEYYGQFLKAEAVADDAGRSDLVGLPNEILDDISLPMNGPDSAGNQDTPDLIAVLDPQNAAIIGNYADEGGAALRASGCQSYRAVYVAAGLEGLGDRSSRAEAMDRVLSWLDAPRPSVSMDLYPPSQEQVWLGGRNITYTLQLRNTGQFTDRFTFEFSSSDWPASVWDGTFSRPLTQSMALGVCQTQTLGVKVTVPVGVSWNISNVVTLTARSLTDPALAARAAFHSKAPAPILLVDDHRWYDTLHKYRAALENNHLPYDLSTTRPAPFRDASNPSLRRLQRYPIVIWFTAYN